MRRARADQVCRCGASNATDARWCGNCGAFLGGSAAPRTGSLRAWRAPAGLVALLAVVGVLGWMLGGDREDPGSGEGAVALPSPAEDLAPAWSRRHPDGPVVATPEHVVVQSPDATAARGAGTSVVLDRATGTTLAAAGHDWTDWHALGVTGQRLLLAVDDRELVLLDLAGGQPAFRDLGELGGTDERLPGASHLLRRAFLIPSGAYLQAGSSMVALDIRPDAEPEGARLLRRWRWADQHVLSSGLTDDGPYVVVVDGVVALDPATGSVRWRHRLVTFNNRPHVVATGALVIADDEGSVTALDTRTGEVRWQRTQTDGPITQVALAGDTVVAVGATGQMRAHDLDSGAVVWRLDRPEVRIESTVASADSVVLTGVVRQGSAIVIALGDDGQQRWTRSVSSLQDVELGRGLVVVGHDTGATAFDELTGAPRWSVSLGDPTAVVDIGANVILTTSDRVVAVPLEDSPT